MNKLVCAAVLSLLAAPAFAADVGVSISVGQPGFYGQINIGAIPAPPVVYAQPVVAVRSPEYVAVEPIYLHVPPGHERHWSRHCAEYHACGRPVYFVRDEWYNKEYVPRYAHEHRDHDDAHGRWHGHDDDHDHGRWHGHDEDHDHGHERHDDDHGHEHVRHDDDHGHGHDDDHGHGDR